MATKKAGGSAKNQRDSKPKYLGVKVTDGDAVKPGMVIVRQRGTKVVAGRQVGVGRDHTLFALAGGTVKFRNTRKSNFDGRSTLRKVVDVI